MADENPPTTPPRRNPFPKGFQARGTSDKERADKKKAAVERAQNMYPNEDRSNLDLRIKGKAGKDDPLTEAHSGDSGSRGQHEFDGGSDDQRMDEKERTRQDKLDLDAEDLPADREGFENPEDIPEPRRAPNPEDDPDLGEKDRESYDRLVGLALENPDGIAALMLEAGYVANQFDEFLEGHIITSKSKTAVADGMLAKDAAKHSIIAGGAASSAERVIKSADREKDEPAYNRDQFSFNDLTRLGQVWSVGTNASVNPTDEDKLWRDMKDCIPCMQWTWGDLDVLWDQFLAILQADLNARIGMFLNLKGIFAGNPLLDELCQLLRLFKNLCPQDLLMIGVMMAARLVELLKSMRIDPEGLLKDIIGTLLRPFILGLENFLNAYGSFLYAQIDCILNIIQVTSEVLAKMGGDKKNIFDSTAETMKEIDAFAAKGIQETAEFIAEDIPGFILGNLQKAADYIARGIVVITDAILEFCYNDWLKSDSAMGLAANLKAVATMLDVIDIIMKLWNNEELCEEKKIEQIVTEINAKIPGVRVEFDDDGDQVVILDDDDDEGVRKIGPQDPPQTSIPEAPETVITFSLKGCLNKVTPDEQHLLDQWIQELR